MSAGEPPPGRPESAPGRPEPPPERSELLDIAIEACAAAAGELVERFEHHRLEGVRSKSTPTDLVSEADLAAERTIRALISQRRPQDGILGEEGEEASGESGLRWIVDPLDGTVNFLFGIPHWCVSVAVADGEGVLAGAIHDPCRGELFAAAQGGLATLGSLGSCEPPRELRCSSKGELSSAMVATGLAYDSSVRAAQAKVLERVIPLARDIRRFGSAALDLAWTAAGRYDAFFERGVKLWDVGAGRLICERSGASVVELEPRPPLPWGILVSPPALVETLLELVE